MVTWRIAHNSCRNWHCPECHGPAARTWLVQREADLPPFGNVHVVFTLHTEIAVIAFQNLVCSIPRWRRC
ncbi:transposase zinc-binding domain-containing protein [Mesorhizobium sp. CAU 1741]|uniref:transposase zinc-binding domain-containing protein n=1 Tax=Mesorhizobium sp. CAU 1741 TaxID=3140366 RepID=UPI00325BBFE6